jgi:membrane-associated phospholipid phosphatase
MNRTLASVVLFTALVVVSPAAGQTTEPEQMPADRLPTITLPQAPVDRPVSWKLLLPNLISDQKRIWSFPVTLVQGQSWIPTAAVLGTTAGLVALDPDESAYFRGTSTFHGFNRIFDSRATAVGTIVAPVSLYVAGLVRKDSKMQRTALLAGEAVADAEVLTTVLKDATRRVRPAAVPAKGNLSDSWFEGGGSLYRGSGSFPSGHTIAAFSIATVIARRYGGHRWVPFAAYGTAALVGFSRLSLSSHFLSDVFMGGALGYSVSRFTVLRQ